MGCWGRFGNGKPKELGTGERMGIFRGKHTFREEAARGAGGGRRRLAVRGPPGPPDQPNKRAGGGGRKAPAPLPVQGAKRPAAAPPAPLGQPPTPKRREVRRPGGWVTPPGWSLGRRPQRGRRDPQARQGRRGAGQRPAGRGICPVDSIGPPARRTPGAAGSSRHSRGCR